MKDTCQIEKPIRTTNHMRSESQLAYHTSMELQYMLGNNYANTPSAHAHVCTPTLIVSYAKNIFTKLDITTKQTTQFVEDCSDIGRAKEGQIILSKYFKQKSQKVLMVLKKAKETHYISMFWIDEGTTSMIKICTQASVECINFTFHPKKNLLYLLITDKSGPKSQQFIRVVEIEPKTSECKLKSGNSSKNKILLNCLLKKTGGVSQDLNDLTVSSDTKEIFLIGVNYFRQWALSFNEKSAKESNYRNIERNLKTQTIINFFWVKQSDLGKNSLGAFQNSHHSQCPNYLILVTSKILLIVKGNQLLKKIQIPVENPFFRIEQEPTQIALEKSLNQIYKTKFRMFPEKQDEQDDEIKQVDSRGKKTQKNEESQICAVSEGWVGLDQEGNKEVKFIGVFKNDKIFVYKILSDLDLKIESQINSNIDPESTIYSFASSIRNVSVSHDGYVALFRDELSNVYYLHQEEGRENNEITPFYGIGHPHRSAVISLSTPQLSMLMSSVSDNGSLKVWSYEQEEKKLLIDNKPKIKPLSAIIHPCGFMVIVNFGLQIKIYGIVSSDLSQLVAIKTSDICIELSYSKSAHILVSNEKSMIKLYEPFTLKCTGKIQPQDMRLEIIRSFISDNGEFIVYQCNDFTVYRKSLNSIYLLNHEKINNGEYLQQKAQKILEKDSTTFCHKQTEEYTCFYFDFGHPKSLNNANLLEDKQMLLKQDNIFVGFTRNKYMVVYSNYGQELVAEFPIQDCYILQVIVKGNIMFASTSKGSIKTYLWPIQQYHCEIEKFAKNQEKAFLKPPKPLQQFQVWMDYTPITYFHLLPNQNQLVAGSKDGYIGFVSYKIMKHGKELYERQDCQFKNERKKMIKAMNNIKLMKVSEIDRINKLIDKTETDIQKIDFQIKNEKIRKNIAIDQEQKDYEKNLAKRRNAYFQQCNESYDKILMEIKVMEKKLTQRKVQVGQKIESQKKIYEERKKYQKEKIESVIVEQEGLKKQHRNRILDLIQNHKENIKGIKKENLHKIFKLEKDFERFVEENFTQSYEVVNMNGIIVNQDYLNEEIQAKTLRVEQLKNDIAEKQKNLRNISEKYETMEEEDENLQEIFENHLEVYNNRRESNLILHSELLKMQNQLLERKQILTKKDELIALAFQQKQANLTFRDFVKGSLGKMEEQKGKAIDFYMKKQVEMNTIFEQLRDQIKKGEGKKLDICRLDEKITLFEKEKQLSENKIKMLMEKIQQFKKFLLLQGVSEDTEQKKIYQDQEKLLVQIKWLQKRFAMACINETKIVSLKKSGMRQVIQQNKNLLEECNQLREEGIDYDKEINHLRQKLGDANKIIEFERKIRNQNEVLSGQTQKLDLIRKMFKDQIDSARKEIEQEEDVEFAL